MAGSPNAEKARSANVRLCRLHAWSNYQGLGFNLEPASSPPHFVRTVDSNSPAAAGGLRILDFVVAVNDQDVSESDYQTVKDVMKNAARDSNTPIELLVSEQRNYNTLKTQGLSIDPDSAAVIETPRKMPSEYKYFPRNKPRTCDIRLSTKNEPFGFEIVNGPNDTGVQIQEVVPNSPAGKTSLRKSDRVLEIDDNFIDNDSSSSITKKLIKAKAKGAVKLYVVDTHTYAFFQKTKVPLKSKEFQKGNFEQKITRSSVINPFETQSDLDDDEDDRPIPSSKPSTLRRDTRPSHPDDIRFCTINRADATDRFGMEFNYQKREHIYLLKITQGRDDGPSNAALAGVKSEDRLIEINGENIENLDTEQLKQRIRSIKHPEPLQMLVVDTATYEYYRKQSKLIHRRLPNARVLPPNIPDQSALPNLPPRRPNDPKPKNSSTQASSVQARILYIPKDSQLLNGFGFNFRTITNDSSSTITYSHMITLIDNNPLMDSLNLRVNDYILSINNEDMKYANYEQLKEKFRRIANNETIRLEVAEENLDQPSLQKSKMKKDNNEQSTDNRRRYRLQRNPKFENYGFRIRSNGTSHQIISVESQSPADVQGLPVGDYIVRINNQTVQKLNSNELNYLIKNNNTSDGILLLEVMNEDAYRSSYGLSSTDQPNSQSPNSLSMNEKVYPKMRLCTVQPWTHYNDLGFRIIQSSNTPGSNNGYQIQQVRLESPAAHTQICNDDHLIEINEMNVERANFQYVDQLIIDSYRRDGQISLLVIDDTGYQWYKRNRININPSSTKANITRHTTPKYSSAFTSVDSISTDSVSNQKKSKQNDNHLPLKNYSQIKDMSLTSSLDCEETARTNQRFFDIQNEPKVMLLPIEGYENTPLVPLITAIENLEHYIPKVKRNAWIAKERSTNPCNELTTDESAAIQLYTMEWKPGDQSFYANLNAALRSEDREQLIPYFLYLKLVLTALWKLKPVRKTIWRGVKADLNDDYPVGKTVVWWGFGSCTESLDVLQSGRFLGQTGVRTLFSIECETGRSIRSHTYFKKENEILLLPATQLRVEGRIDSGNGLHIIHLVETTPPFPLLQQPYPPEENLSTCF